MLKRRALATVLWTVLAVGVYWRLLARLMLANCVGLALQAVIILGLTYVGVDLLVSTVVAKTVSWGGWLISVAR